MCKNTRESNLILIKDESIGLGGGLVLLFFAWIEFTSRIKPILIQYNIYSSVIAYSLLYIPTFFLCMTFLRMALTWQLRDKNFVAKLKTMFLIWAIAGTLNALYSVFLYTISPSLNAVNANQSDIYDSIDLHSMFVIPIIVVFVAPIVEEIIFRGIIFGILRKRTFILAHITSAFLFAFYHVYDYVIYNHDFGQLIGMMSYVIAGLGLSITYEKTQHLKYCIIYHITQNSVSLCFLVIGKILQQL